jgi:hypothetical protein
MLSNAAINNLSIPFILNTKATLTVREALPSRSPWNQFTIQFISLCVFSINIKDQSSRCHCFQLLVGTQSYLEAVTNSWIRALNSRKHRAVTNLAGITYNIVITEQYVLSDPRRFSRVLKRDNNLQKTILRKRKLNYAWIGRS